MFKAKALSTHCAIVPVSSIVAFFQGESILGGKEKIVGGESAIPEPEGRSTSSKTLRAVTIPNKFIPISDEIQN